MNIRKVLPLLVVVLSSGNAVEALPPTTSSADGVVRSVDSAMRTFTVDRSSGKALVLRWNSKTLFVRDAKNGDAAFLQKGMRVNVRYRAPFFGPWIASRISF